MRSCFPLHCSVTRPRRGPTAPSASRILALASNVQDDLATIGTVDVLSGTIPPLAPAWPTAAPTPSSTPRSTRPAAATSPSWPAAASPAQRLLTFNTQTGAVTASTPLTNTVFVNYMAYDTASSQLLALVFTNEPFTLQVARINPATAALTLLNNPIPDCCSPIAFDAAYDDVGRKLYAVIQPYVGEPQPRLVTFSGADGSVLADVPITTTLELDHLAYDASAATLWALGYDAATGAERLAAIDTATGAVTPLGAGAASCCNRMVTDVAVDPLAQVLIAPMVDTSAGGFPVPTFFRFSLTTGEVLGSAPIDPAYSLYYIAYDPMPPAPPTPTATSTSLPTATPAASLYLPSIQCPQQPVGDPGAHTLRRSPFTQPLRTAGVLACSPHLPLSTYFTARAASASSCSRSVSIPSLSRAAAITGIHASIALSGHGRSAR